MLRCAVRVLTRLQGNLSAPTTWLLRAVLPARCLWTSLRDVEELSFDSTIKAFKGLYHASDGDDDVYVDAEPRLHGLSSAVPEAVLSMIPQPGRGRGARVDDLVPARAQHRPGDTEPEELLFV